MNLILRGRIEIQGGITALVEKKINVEDDNLSPNFYLMSCCSRIRHHSTTGFQW